MFVRNTKLPVLVKRFIINWHYRHSYLIWIGEQVFHACTKTEVFVEKKSLSSSIFICVSCQASGSLHILHWVVTCTK